MPNIILHMKEWFVSREDTRAWGVDEQFKTFMPDWLFSSTQSHSTNISSVHCFPISAAKKNLQCSKQHFLTHDTIGIATPFSSKNWGFIHRSRQKYNFLKFKSVVLKTEHIIIHNPCCDAWTMPPLFCFLPDKVIKFTLAYNWVYFYISSLQLLINYHIITTITTIYGKFRTFFTKK